MQMQPSASSQLTQFLQMSFPAGVEGKLDEE